MAGFLGAEFKLVILVGLRGITGGEGLCSNQRLRKNASMLLVGCYFIEEKQEWIWRVLFCGRLY